MKQALAIALSLITASTSFASSTSCPTPLTSNILVNHMESDALVFQRFDSGRVLFKACKVVEKSVDQVVVNHCAVVGSELGYSAQDLVELNKSFKTSNRALRYAINSVIFIGAGTLGLIGGGLFGIHFGPSGGHGMAEFMSGIMGAAAGGLAGSICGGLVARVSSARQKTNNSLNSAVAAATQLASQSNIMPTEQSVTEIIANLRIAFGSAK